MMSKVKLTQEQADAIEELITVMGYKHEEIIRLHSVNPSDWVSIGKPLNSMPLLDLVDSLRIGYEVEPEFKVGDWVVHENGHSIRQVTGFSRGHLEVSDGEDGYIWDKPFVRHATPEEIAEEKERRWWAKHGREPWELRTDDVLTRNDDGFPWFVDGKRDTLPGYYLNGESFNLQDIIDRYRVMVFAENRLDVKDDE